MLGDELSPPRFGDLIVERAALLLQEYQEVNAHLRANTSRFVNGSAFSNEPAHGRRVCGNAQLPASAGSVRAALCVQLDSLLMHIPSSSAFSHFPNGCRPCGCGICVVLLHLAVIVVLA
jgi:hypothetical protein